MLRAAWLTLVLAAWLLTGCATSRKVDSEVQSFVGKVQPASNASYRFERLPSQTHSSEQQAFEAMASRALERVGLLPASGNARYSVQLHVQITRFQKTPGTALRWGGLAGRRGELHGGSWMTVEQDWWRHSVQLVMRETDGNQVVFESTAHFDGPWSDSARLLPAVMEAALQGYPNPPAGARTVVIELPFE